MNTERDDRIFLSTRLISAGVVPFLLLAFIILYFYPQLSGQRFAWQVQPTVMAVYIGAGYLGGAYLFLHTLFGRRWHHVAVGFPAIATFTVSMLLATVLHWSRFDIHHFPFQLWLGLYIITPLLVPWMWLHNRGTDPKTLDPHDVVVPGRVRGGVRALGLVLLGIALVGFLVPSLLIQIWPWRLSVLTAQLLAGWGALLGVGNLVVAGEARWSGWRVGVESIAIWHLLFLVGAGFHRQEFSQARFINWYTLSVVGIVILMVVLYVTMEVQRSQKRVSHEFAS
ncbi:MAG TPA: hypothetical protein DEP84_16355 [Chloroflexi bacterium]|nr:hypothetical protein [Chloroflexota bacterium]